MALLPVYEHGSTPCCQLQENVSALNVQSLPLDIVGLGEARSILLSLGVHCVLPNFPQSREQTANHTKQEMLQARFLELFELLADLGQSTKYQH
jgi:hypothetical protein